jgi:hypothetical protein
MSPTSRNTLRIGGALILIALLLVCGPLSDRFGSAGAAKQEAPSVAAGPPPDAAGPLAAAATGALAGAVLGEAGGVGTAGRVVDRFAPPVAAPARTSVSSVARPLGSDVLIRPCDRPGSGCRNVTSGAGSVNPPLVPGRPPPVS